ncbi:MAG: VWA domain-containing protein [Synergistaceae bacterium]|jgi:Ca-activated chloride channel family protein|nr:VWA domain-containing protein [Synergistaceae bacterium]
MTILLSFIFALPLALLVVFMMARAADAAFLNLSMYDNSHAERPPFMEVRNRGKNKARRFVPLKESRLVGTVEGPLAALSLSQKYSFTKAQSSRPLEVLYRFPLPGDAAVRGAVVRFGDVEIKTSLKERDEARSEYDAARDEGRQAAFVSRESEDSFTMSITGIKPDVEVEVVVDFTSVAEPEEPGWALRFPLTVPPRYVREDEDESRAASNPLAIAVDPGHRFSMELEFRDARNIASSTHEINVKTDSGVSAVTLAKGTVMPERDLLLSWRPDVEGDVEGNIEGKKIPFAGVLYTENDGEDTYFMLLAAAGQGKEASPTLKREVSLLIDHSGSMEGAKWEAADWAAKKFLSDLGEGDYFDVAFFHHDMFPLSKRMLRASPENVAKAVDFVLKNRSSGGTELGMALERMLMIPKASPKERIARQLLIITDAEVTDEGRILELARRESENETRRRISVLCIDASPNATLTNRLAERGGGTAAYLTSDPDAKDVTTAVDEILSRWSRPVAESVRLDLNADSLSLAGRRMRTATPGGRGGIEVELGSLMGGEPLWIIGKMIGFREKEPVRVHFDDWSADLEIRSSRAKRKRKRDAIRTLYGARRIQELEFLKISGLSGGELRDELASLGCEIQGEKGRLYEENERISVEKAIDGLLLEESLRYGVLSSQTALVASRTEKGKPVGDTVLTANALPHGWDDAFMYASAGRPTGPSGAMEAPCAAPPMSRLCQVANAQAFALFDAKDVKEDAVSGNIPIYDAGITVPGAGEVELKEIAGSGRLSGLSLSETSLKALSGEKLEGLLIRIFIDGGASPSAGVKLSDLVRLGGERPLNISYAQSARFVLANDGDETVTLENLSIFAR